MVMLSAAAHVAAAILIVSGAAKLRAPDPVRGSLRALRLPSSAGAARALGAVELVVGAAGLLAGREAGAAAVGAWWLALAVAAFVLRRRGDVDCGCFGAAAAPVGTRHVVVDGLFGAGALAAAAVEPPDPFLERLGGSSLVLAAATLVLVAAGAAAAATILTTAPPRAT